MKYRDDRTKVSDWDKIVYKIRITNAYSMKLQEMLVVH